MVTLDDIETLFKTNYSRMHSLAAAILHDNEAAYDIVHDVFASILDGGAEKHPDSAYLMRSVRNRCLNRLKAIDIRERFRQLYLIENDESDDLEDWPEEDTIALIEQSKKEMPPKCLEVFTMRFYDGLSASEISRILGTGERVVYKHLSHALNILKRKLNG